MLLVVFSSVDMNIEEKCKFESIYHRYKNALYHQAIGKVVYTLKSGEFLTRTGISTNGWSRLEYNGQTVYAITSYLTK